MSSADVSPRAKVNYDQDKFSVEFCVQDYAPEELSIKTEGDVLIVLAKQESKTNGGKSSSKQFEQRFTLPSGVDPEKISSKLSKEGVLTVTAPREAVSISAFKKTEALENKNNGLSKANSSEGLKEPKMVCEKDKIEISVDAKEYSPEDLDVKVEGSFIIVTAKKEIQEGGRTGTRVFEQKFGLPSGVKPELVKSSLTSEGMLVITAPRGNISAQRAFTETIEKKMDQALQPSSWDKEMDSKEYRRPSAFDEIRRDSEINEKRIESAFDELRRDSNFSTKHDSFFDSSKSNLLNQSLMPASSDYNGISKVQVDDDNYNIIVNVENFKPEELVIKTIDNRVVVEAKHEEKTSNGNTYSTQSLNQSFSLPKGVDPESVSSSLSKQGVLTISAPLPKQLKSSQSGQPIPIKHL